MLSLLFIVPRFYLATLPYLFPFSRSYNALPMQESGDIMFVPQMWGHGVMNMAESIGFAQEFLFGGSEFSMG